MKRLVTAFAVLSLMPAAFAAPGGPEMWHGHGHDHGPGPGPGFHYDHLPPGVETVLIAGLTYYVLNGIFYRPDQEGYVVVDNPDNIETTNTMTVLDVNGERFYVKDGRYYRHTVEGDYIEVPRPPGL